MREIKFRAWVDVGEGLKMYDDFGCVHLEDKEMGINYSLKHLQEVSGFKLMQFTGLLDKNGKEIYEGDILKTDGGKCEVYWYQPACCFRWKFGHDLTSPLNYDDVEVIGNIYENPELLNK